MYLDNVQFNSNFIAISKTDVKNSVFLAIWKRLNNYLGLLLRFARNYDTLSENFYEIQQIITFLYKSSEVIWDLKKKLFHS